jgi:hypothetical protein
VWHQSNDTLYQFSFISTWGTVEFICGYLVFAIPAFPRAFPREKVATIFLSLRSWAGTLAQRLKRTMKGSTSEGSYPGETEKTSHTYRQVEDQPPKLPLRSFEPGMSTIEAALSDPNISNRSILQTVEFTTVESISSQRDTDPLKPHAQNWYLKETLSHTS